MLQEHHPLADTQTQTQTEGNSQWELMDNHDAPQKVTWGQLFTRHITIIDKGQKFNVFPNAQQFNITEEVWGAGRAETLDFIFKGDVFPQNLITRISKVHFRISRDLKNPLKPVYIEDLSRNGTYVGGQLIGLGAKRILRSNDMISVINAEYRFFVFHDMMPDLSHSLPKVITSKYFVGPELGSGACGVVRLVYDVETCKEYAMKQVVKMRLEDPGQKILNDPERIMNEVAIMKSLAHPCIVRMFDIHDRPESVFMILELMRGGDMISRISKMPQRRLPEASAKFFFIQMCEAIKYLHDKGITHRDIKPDNILLASEDEDTLLKVTDFGLSKFVKKNSIMKTLCGTPQYVAPEILTTRGKGSYTKKVDIWSMGCCLYACLAGCVPFTGGDHGDIQHIAHDIVKGSLRFDPVRWGNVSRYAKEVVTMCLTKNAAQRPSIEDLRGHRWLNDESVIKRVEKVMGCPVLRDTRDFMRPRVQPEVVTTNRVMASTGRSLFIMPPGVRSTRVNVNSVRGSTPSVAVVPTSAAATGAVPRPVAVAPAREYQEEPPLKRSRMER